MLAGDDAYSCGGRAGEVGVAGRWVKLAGGSGKGSVVVCECERECDCECECECDFVVVEVAAAADLYGGKCVESWGGGDEFGVGWFLLASLGVPETENWDMNDKTVPTEADLVSIIDA